MDRIGGRTRRTDGMGGRTESVDGRMADGRNRRWTELTDGVNGRTDGIGRRTEQADRQNGRTGRTDEFGWMGRVRLTDRIGQTDDIGGWTELGDRRNRRTEGMGRRTESEGRWNGRWTECADGRNRCFQLPSLLNGEWCFFDGPLPLLIDPALSVGCCTVCHLLVRRIGTLLPSPPPVSIPPRCPSPPPSGGGNRHRLVQKKPQQCHIA